MPLRSSLSPLEATASSLLSRSYPLVKPSLYPSSFFLLSFLDSVSSSSASFSSSSIRSFSSYVLSTDRKPSSFPNPITLTRLSRAFVSLRKPVRSLTTISTTPSFSSFSSRLTTKYKDSPVGLVENITGDTVIVKGLTRATPHSLILFQNGALGLTIDIRKDNSLKIVLISGTVLLRETAIVITNNPDSLSISSSTVSSIPPTSTTPLSLTVTNAILGRIIDPLGQPLDGLGSYITTPSSSSSTNSNAARVQSLFASPVPSITERERAYSTLPTGIKAWDSFTPLLRGQTTILYGEKGIGKTHTVIELMEHIAKLNDIHSSLHDERNRRITDATTENPYRLSSTLPLSTDYPIHMVYVAIGTPINILKDILRKFQQILPLYNPDHPANSFRNILRYVTVVAAPSSSHIGAQYLAPFTGAAIGEYFRNQGKHALVIYDDLSVHFTVSRRIAGTDWNRTSATPTLHAQLFERHAQLKRNSNDSSSGGSLTGLALIDNLPPSTTTIQASPDTGKTREFITNLCSLADNTVELTTEGFRSGALFPINFATMGIHPAHAAQGSTLRYYINRLRETLVDLRETARGASAAASLGVETENDQADVLLDMHAKARALLNPTHNLLRAVVEASSSSSSSPVIASSTSTASDNVPFASPLSPEQITQLGIEGLTFPVVGPGQRHNNQDTDNSSTDEGNHTTTTNSSNSSNSSSSSSTNPNLNRRTSFPGTNTETSSTIVKGILSSSPNKAMDRSSVEPLASLKSRSFSTVAKNNEDKEKTENTNQTLPASNPPSSSTDKYATLVNRMDPSQLRTYYAVAQRRQKKTVSAQMAAAASGGGNISASSSKQSAAEIYFTSGKVPASFETTTGIQHAKKEKKDNSTPSSPSTVPSTASSSPPTSTASSANTFNRRSAGFTGIYGNRTGTTGSNPNGKTTDSSSNGTASNVSSTLPSSTVTRSYSVWLPRRYFSTATTEKNIDATTSNTSSPSNNSSSMEKSFRLPSHRPLPVQTFADICTAVPPSSSTSDDSLSSSSSSTSLSIYNTVNADQAGVAGRLAPLWEEAPYKGDTGRLFCTLFILVHGYVQSIPLHRIYEYEAGLYNLLASLPYTLPFDPSASSSSVTTQHLPLASYTLGYPTLLDIAMNTTVSSSMITQPYIDIGTRLREATQTFIRQSSELTTTEENLRIKQEEFIKQQQQAFKKKKASKGWFSTLFGSGSKKPTEKETKEDSPETINDTQRETANRSLTVPSTTGSPSHPPTTVAQILSRYDRSLIGYVRLDIAIIDRTTTMEDIYRIIEEELLTMEPVFAITHIVVAEYTRKFLQKIGKE